MSTPVVVVYGDSISTGTHGNGGYLAALASGTGATLRNHAVGGSPLADVAPGALVALLRRPDHLHPDATAVLVWHGTNDWYWGSPLGAPGTVDPATFRGALATSVSTIREAAPGVPILVPTPLPRHERPDGGACAGDAWVTANRVGATLADYTAVLVEEADALGYRCLDMIAAAGLARSGQPHLYEDGVHPNEAGYALIAPPLVAAVRALWGSR